MANLTAVLRKTIDGLPNATPQLRAKVYEKARAAITRQIQSADPPLAEHVAEQRYRVLEEAIAESEAHYLALSGEGVAQDAPSPPPEAPEPPRAAPAAPPPPAPVREPPPPPFPRATPTMRPPAAPAQTFAPSQPERASPPAPEAPRFERSSEAQRPSGLEPSVPVEPRASDEMDAPVGVIGPAPAEPPLRQTRPDAAAERLPVPDRAPRTNLRPASPMPAPAESRSASPSPGAILSGIPEADLAAPRYPARRATARNRTPLMAAVAVVALLGLGALGWAYLDDIRSVVLGSPQTASAPVGTGQSTDSAEAPAPTDGTVPETAAPPSGTVTDVAPATPTTTPPAPGGRQFTQRLLPDGTEVDEGPGASAPNAFEEGTDVAAATIAAPTETAPPAAAAPATVPEAAPATQPPANAPTGTPAAVPVGQRAVFYEERSADREGTQQSGNVVWSLASEPPADGQPPEPAIRASVDVPDSNLRMTMTIRRNADATLPASHVIEIMFDTPAGFPGGAIENVQRLALKPTEQARGEPLIGVAGKISDGFFIIALNDLPQAVQSNLALLGREEWIDIPIAYASGQRALMSIEKGITGDRIFREAIEAWNGRT
ncbi:hypothetical protein [Aureimonas sp. SK2]|uniref:hypothetical protein n=1 Tax=Aureimonas sp. SK2 TaxID=3015992 RepID=UPI002444420A|nr:hypothetical protein [Aureimonas sp. SK2]